VLSWPDRLSLFAYFIYIYISIWLLVHKYTLWSAELARQIVIICIFYIYIYIYIYILWHIIYGKKLWTSISIFPARKYVNKIWRVCLSHYTSRLAISIFNIAALEFFFFFFFFFFFIFFLLNFWQKMKI
jgi:hypothetical protein